MTRCLRVANYLRAKLVDDLDLENIKLPETTKSDPFIARPLVLRETDDGILIYSLGRNRLDDGGEVANDRDFGFQILRNED